MVHRQVGQYFAVEFDILFAEHVNEARISRAIHTCSGIDTSDPELAESAFFAFAVAISVLHTLFQGVFGYGVDFATCAKIAACGFEDSFASLA